MLGRTPANRFVLFIALASLTLPAVIAQPGPPADTSGTNFKNIDEIMQQAVEKGTIPGGVVLITHNGRTVYRKAFGWRSLEPTRERMTVDTIFDLASLTKCVVTATLIMKLVEEGKVRLNDPVTTYLPEFGKNGKSDITLRDLLTHFSDLPDDLDLTSPWEGRETAYRMIMESKPLLPPGSTFHYSDLDFEALGFIVEKASGMSLNDFAAKEVFGPLEMKESQFNPPAGWRPRIAPTEYDEHHRMLRGVVHDPTARRMGGVAGHAGLFSTADDLSRFAQDMLSGFKVLSEQTVEKMSTPQQPPTAASLRGLGWDIDSPFASNRGEMLPVGSFGHTGFTGTSLWIDPVTHTSIIILTNAAHPHAGKSLASLRARIATAVVSDLDLTSSENDELRLARITGYNETLFAARRVHFRNGEVKSGIDVLETHNFSDLHPTSGTKVRVGLVTNHTGVDAMGHRTIDVLSQAPGVEVAVIFSPEHGIAGTADTADIANSHDRATGTPIISVYGDTDAKRHPNSENLEDLDAIVFDIQDIGVRFYTYESTLGYFLEAAAKSGKEIFVLDRPNPIGGAYLQGTMPDPNHESFVNYGQVPLRHGMTIGELAKLYNEERGIHANLTVVPMQGWMRGDWYDSAGMRWIDPSPNIRSLTAATLYSGVGLIEGTNVSVGRGTDTPFELVGAPWINSLGLAKYLNARAISGVRFVPRSFMPNANQYARENCGGVNIIVVDRNVLDAPELGLELASALHTLYPAEYKMEKLDLLLVNQASFDALRDGRDPRRIAEDWMDALEEFRKIRAKYLIY
ncbi:MAG: serine hydrolase [Terriglobales bacterium]